MELNEMARSKADAIKRVQINAEAYSDHVLKCVI